MRCLKFECRQEALKANELERKLKIATDALTRILRPQVDSLGNWLSDTEANASQTIIAREALEALKEGE